MKRDEEQWMKPERIQIWARLVEGARSIGATTWDSVKAVFEAVKKFFDCLSNR